MFYHWSDIYDFILYSISVTCVHVQSTYILCLVTSKNTVYIKFRPLEIWKTENAAKVDFKINSTCFKFWIGLMLKVYHTKMINIKYTIILQPAARSFCLTFSNSCFIFEHKVNISYYIGQIVIFRCDINPRNLRKPPHVFVGIIQSVNFGESIV